ncbi:MAG: hypothetical protein L6Q84_26795 [Polyangiaceae bacterium]|nr:hypothetical protein [Polyangiaceae bacterium]
MGSTPPKTRRKGRRRRVLTTLVVGVPVLAIGLWIAVHKIPWLGPMLANTLRAVVGTDNVAKLEDFVYGVEDRFNRWYRKDDKPKAYWDVPAEEAKPADAGVPDGAAPEWQLTDVGPIHEKWSAPGDGKWVKIKDPRRPDEPAFMYKTLLHPDKNRSWAEVFVVGVDLRRVRLQAMPGYREPYSLEKESKALARRARVPDEDHEELLAAFNGGFMTEHGYFGMKYDGVTLVKPRETACTMAQLDDGSLTLATWKKIAASEPKIGWFRQMPGCMYEDEKIHPGLADPDTRLWGATLDGETVIRRSAIGINAARDVLYVGISNHTTAKAIADGMRHAGAVTVGQLDVNWSYPKFVLFEPKEAGGPRKAVPLAAGFEFDEDEYIRKRSLRDFFYLVRKPRVVTAQN